jgi:hypothetical protein
VPRHEHAYPKRIAGHAAEMARKRLVAKIAEPLLDGLSPRGVYRFPPEQFRALAEFLLEDEPGKFEMAVARDRFRVITLEFVCDRELTLFNTMTVSEFARARGVLQRTMAYRVSKSQMRCVIFGKTKRYDIRDLEQLLENTGRKG